MSPAAPPASPELRGLRERLAHFSALLDLEAQASADRAQALRAREGRGRLEAEGVLLRGVRAKREQAAFFGRVRIELSDAGGRPGRIERFAAQPGDVVRVADRGGAGPLGVVTEKASGRLLVVFDAPPALGEDGRMDLWLCADDVTIERMKKAASACQQATGRPAQLMAMLLGLRTPSAPREDHERPLDKALNTDQRRAVNLALFAPDLALIHGPFGTGKTRVLVEIVRLLRLRGERVLCLTASNAAVDHLALALLERDPELPLLRVGDPARTHPALHAHGLDAAAAKTPAGQRARGLEKKAQAALADARRQGAKGRGALAKARDLLGQARKLQRQVARELVENTRVLCGTLTGHARDLRAADAFDVLVVDEASQVLTPALLLAVPRVKRVVLAGDHRQLPPTVMSRAAQKQGLASTAFDELMARGGRGPCAHMLTVQHRMPEALMRFSSEQFYEGRLSAHPDVADARLQDLLDPSTDDALLAPTRPLALFDTQDAGLKERRERGGPSRDNPGQARLVRSLVLRLIQAGIAAEEIGVITPYGAQVGLLRHLLRAQLRAGLEVDSVDAFQGREKQVVIFDAVRSNDRGDVGFLADPRRLNVAITRASHKLMLVADRSTLSADELWAALFVWADALEAAQPIEQWTPLTRGGEDRRRNRGRRRGRGRGSKGGQAAPRGN